MRLNTVPLVDVPDSSGKTPLHVASCHGHFKFMRILMRHNANASSTDNAGDQAPDLVSTGVLQGELTNLQKQVTETLETISVGGQENGEATLPLALRELIAVMTYSDTQDVKLLIIFGMEDT